MRIALTFAARGSGPVEDPDTDATAAVELFASGLGKLGHEVERIDVRGSPARVIARLEASPPDLVVNLAEGAMSRTRDDLYTAIFEELNLPCVGADTRTLCLFTEKLARGASLEDALRDLVKKACKRFNLPEKPESPKRQKRALRVGLTFNVKREHGDEEAEFDSPKTIDAIAAALESYGHTVVHLEADADLPMSLAGALPDVVFNVAEGHRGRGREAQVPALCEMLGIPYTGSDPTTLAICLDKSLAKQILRAAGIDTPAWQLLTTGREKLRPMRYPVIVKPNAEGTSKGITGASVVMDEAGVRAAARVLIDRYGQPALVEEYIRGREFTVGLLGDKRPRVLPIMEVIFVGSPDLPVYGFEEKQSDTPRVRFECPANLTPAEQRKIEKVARDTFAALDCRDVARVDLRIADDGTIFVFEVNPLPGLAPDFSDLCVIAKHAGMDHKALIGEILAGAIKRLEQGRSADKPSAGTVPPPGNRPVGSLPLPPPPGVPDTKA